MALVNNPTPSEVVKEVKRLDTAKQNTLTAGSGITISGDIISATGTTIPIDSALSDSSINPVQNKVVKAAVDAKADKSATNTTTGYSTIINNDSDGLVLASYDGTDMEQASEFAVIQATTTSVASISQDASGNIASILADYNSGVNLIATDGTDQGVIDITPSGVSIVGTSVTVNNETVATMNDIPDVSNFLTEETFVSTTDVTPLSNYYTKSETNNLFSKVTLNGASSLTPNFYAPLTPGSNGYFLKSNGSGAPVWSNDVANVSLSNVTATRTRSSVTLSGKTGTKYTGKHLCIESWRSSDRTSGYRLFDDGYCEQWGFVYPKTSSTVTVTLFKAYYDANYNVTLAAHWTGNHADDVNNSNKTASSFQLVSGSSNSGFGVYWKACGYIN